MNDNKAQKLSDDALDQVSGGVDGMTLIDRDKAKAEQNAIMQ